MPTYEYSCPECGHRFDIWQPVGSAAPACEKCASATKKVFHPSRVIFKGPGFYVTDLASEKSAANKTKESAESSKGDSKESKEASPVEGKAEAKSESKESKPAEAAPASTSGASDAGSDKK